jgi:copper chaperone CopZ
MNNIIKSFALSILLIGSLSFLVSAVSEPKAEKLVFKSSTVCKTCKTAIESTLQKVDGVLISLVNLSTKNVSVKYNPAITNPDKIKEAILKSGYNFNDEKPTKEDYEKLPTCCKKDGSASCNEKH